MSIYVVKRDKTRVEFDKGRIVTAIESAMNETDAGIDRGLSNRIADMIRRDLEVGGYERDVEVIQDLVEEYLMKSDRTDVAKKYILYREERARKREHSAWDLTDLQFDIWKRKYEFANEGFEGFFYRVSGGSEEVKKLMRDKKFLAGGRTLSSRGLQNYGIKATYSNCYVLPPVEDNLESIFDTAKEAARTFSYGGGCGFDLSNLRPAGSRVENASVVSTGPNSFIDIYSVSTECIAQKGRRGALLLSQACYHPDVEDFIRLKLDPKKIPTANLSVRITDDFMEAIRDGDTYTLRFESEKGDVIEKEVNPRDILYTLSEANWRVGDPGVLYWDRVKSWNLMSEHDSYQIVGVNPCAEQPLPAYGSCNLGAINLSEFVKNPFSENACFDYESFSEVVGAGIRYLDEVSEEGAECHPLRQQKEVVRKWRPVGLGIMGLADALIKLGIRYGSEESLDICRKIGHTMINKALQQSALLAKELGTFAEYDKDALFESEFFQFNATAETKKIVGEYGLRNSQLLTIAPTGSLSTMFGVSGGIEPIISNVYYRETKSLYDESKYYKVYTPIVKEYMERCSITSEEELPDYFVTAKDIYYKDRIRVQSVWQQFIDAGISSTVNVEKDFPIELIESMYILGWELGLKGLTLFRDGCEKEGIISTESSSVNKNELCPECGSMMVHSNGCKECVNCSAGSVCSL